MKKLFLSFVIFFFLLSSLYSVIADVHLEEFVWTTKSVFKTKNENDNTSLQTGSISYSDSKLALILNENVEVDLYA